jgi:hypothetical protein
MLYVERGGGVHTTDLGDEVETNAHLDAFKKRLVGTDTLSFTN